MLLPSVVRNGLCAVEVEDGNNVGDYVGLLDMTFLIDLLKDLLLLFSYRPINTCTSVAWEDEGPSGVCLFMLGIAWHSPLQHFCC